MLSPDDIIDIEEVINNVKILCENLGTYHVNWENNLRNISMSLDRNLRNILLGIIEKGFYCTDYKDFSPMLSLYADQFKERNIVVFPILSKENISSNKVKSSYQLLYTSRIILSQCNKNVTVYDTPFFDPAKHINSVYIGVDDFVGTGDSVLQCASEQAQMGHKPKAKCVATVAIMRNATFTLQENAIASRSQYILESIFSSNVRNIAGNQARTIYTSLAELTSTPANLVLGYKNSEAAAILMQTPDNTLGALWHAFAGIHSRHKAIFHRQQ